MRILGSRNISTALAATSSWGPFATRSHESLAPCLSTSVTAVTCAGALVRLRAPTQRHAATSQCVRMCVHTPVSPHAFAVLTAAP